MLLSIVPATDITYYKSKQVGQSTSKATEVDYLHHTYIYDIIPRKVHQNKTQAENDLTHSRTS